MGRANKESLSLKDMVTLCQDLFHSRGKAVINLEVFKELRIKNVDLLVGDYGTIINKQTGKTIKPHLVGGYYAVNIQTKPNRTKKYVHRLVAMAFLNDGKEFEDTVNHKDYNKKNNSVNNLEIISRKDNAIHSYKQEKHGKRKLSKEEVLQIKSLLINHTIKEITIMLNIPRHLISDVKCGRTYKDV